MILAAAPTPARSAVHPHPPFLLPAGEAFALDCPPCSISGPTYTTRAAVEALVEVHDRMKHKRMNADGAHFARVVPVSAACESCQVRPATRTLPDSPAKGAPFAVCSYCAFTAVDVSA